MGKGDLFKDYTLEEYAENIVKEEERVEGSR